MRDFDADGTQDLAIVNQSSNSVTTFPGNGDGTFGDRRDYLAMGIQPDSLVAEDFNRDGKVDLIVSDSFEDRLLVLQGNGDGTFGPDVSVVALDPGSVPLIVAAGDFDSDGRLDVVVANSGSNNVSILFNNSL